ncbi:DUF6712 family protein [Limnovirga soli]|uniref:Uncharacterized protein n=1 Tax=Limnovirga soli TaxID=2656915 RepID=A0A8J8FGS2_9BACT|nr:DUF6712 family protein [Limnovirga soli]NNV57370.1 hypothetical protein [Limnovirga soli]
MALITDINTVRANGVKVMFINNDSQLADMEAGELRFIEPVLGSNLYNRLVATPTNATFTTLLKKVRAALAPLAYWLDLPNIQSQITDRGAGTFSSDNMQPLHHWEFEALRDALEDKGCFALENLLAYLYANTSTLNWQMPGKFDIIFKTGEEFSNYYVLEQPHRCFKDLRPWIKQVENMYLKPTIGDDFYTELKNKTAPTEEDKIAIELIKNAVANYTIKTAVEKMPVKLSSNGFYTRLGSGGTSNLVKPDEKQSDNSDRLMIRDSAEKDGDRYLLRLKEYLDTNASDTIFASYKTSSYYVAPVDPSLVVNPNTTRGGIYGF